MPLTSMRQKRPLRQKDALPLILLTGFDAFGRQKTNPSEEVLRRLRDDEVPGARLLRVVLPTRYRRAEQGMLDLLKRYRPAAVLSLGVAASRPGVTIEMLALNTDHSEDRDNAGERRLRKRIHPRGPMFLETRLPVDELLRALKRARIPASVSYHAGTYVCNHLFYSLLRKLQSTPSVPAGFVHLPPLKRLLGRGLTFEQQKRAVVAMATVLLRSIRR